jgi:hypothetical protein
MLREIDGILFLPFDRPQQNYGGYPGQGQQHHYQQQQHSSPNTGYGYHTPSPQPPYNGGGGYDVRLLFYCESFAILF